MLLKISTISSICSKQTIRIRTIKTCIFRKDYLEIILEANDKIKKAINHLGQWKYIDLCSPMLETGYEKFYGEDPLHMNVLGYSLLSKLIRDELSVFNN